MAEHEFPTTKWLSVRDVLALVCKRVDRAAAKEELCDCVITQKLILRGERDGRCIFFLDPRESLKLVPSNIDWRKGRLRVYQRGWYESTDNLRFLNDDQLRGLVLGRSLDKPKSLGSANTEFPSKSRGGRPAGYPWDDIWIEICRYIHINGLPETRVELMQHLQQWCENRIEKQPADSTLKPKLRKLYAAFDRIDEN